MPDPDFASIPTNAYLHFESFAFQTNKAGGHNSRKFDVLCGDDPPTIMDGYAKWVVIDRPLRQGVTVPQGYNPAKVSMSVRFGIWDGLFGFRGWDTSALAAEEVEQRIDDLHWMAGGNALAGPSPVIRVYDTVRAGHPAENFLMPRQYWGVPWVIDGGITWGKSLRNRNGQRTFQEATFTLLGYSSFGVPPPRGSSSIPGAYVRAQRGDTILSICAVQSNAPEALLRSLAGKVQESQRNNHCRHSRVRLERWSVTKALPTGLEVWVPSHAT